jgi:translation initiation factor 4A
MNIKICFAIGGTIREMVKELGNNPHVVVCTPGRGVDFIKRQVLNVNAVKMIIFDEFDEMLSRGFGESLKELLTYASTDTRLILSSETVYREITDFIAKFLINP